MEAIESVLADVSFWEAPSISLGEKPDPVLMEDAVKKPLAERAVADPTAAKTTKYHLDHCITVESYTDLFREKMAQAWQLAADRLSTLRTVGGAACFAALFVPAARIIAAVVGLVWVAFTSYRNIKAWEQNRLFNTIPYQKTAEQRTQAYLEPFLAMHRLQGTSSSLHNVLHPNEIEYQYKKYLVNFCDKLLQEKPSSEHEKRVWMANFLTLNPLSTFIMQNGWEKVPPRFEALSQDYNRLFSEQIKPELLHAKFTPHSFWPVYVGQVGMFRSNTYHVALESLVRKYEQLLEDLKNDYLKKREKLKATYGAQMESFSYESSLQKFQQLNDHFEYDLKQIKDPHIAESIRLKAAYHESLKELKTQFTEHPVWELEEEFDKRWDQLQAIIIEDKSHLIKLDDYGQARNLLERAKKELNPPPVPITPKLEQEPPKKTPVKTCRFERYHLYCPFIWG